jgi:probable F420-dependent oxidoreductase
LKIDAHLTGDWNSIPEQVRDLEALGYDRVATVETNHDPFLPLMIAAEHSEKLELGTGIAVAFARNPMNLANIGHDLNAYSKGRLSIGLGSQIRPHITKRFSMPWGAPAAQMKELILAMRAIWANWYDGEPLRFEGKYYQHTLMTPGFVPENRDYGPPRVTLAAVGPVMTQVAAEVADGLIVHPFSNEKYIREVTMPAVEKGLARAGRTREDFEISYSPFIVSGSDEETRNKMDRAIRTRMSFYGSTPAYKNVLGVHGWGDLQPELNRMSKEGKWDDMPALITDEMLGAFSIVEEPACVVAELKSRFGDLIDRTSADFNFVAGDTRIEMIAALKA